MDPSIGRALGHADAAFRGATLIQAEAELLRMSAAVEAQIERVKALKFVLGIQRVFESRPLLEAFSYLSRGMDMGLTARLVDGRMIDLNECEAREGEWTPDPDRPGRLIETAELDGASAPPTLAGKARSL